MSALLWFIIAWPIVSVIAALLLGRWIATCTIREERKTRNENYPAY